MQAPFEPDLSALSNGFQQAVARRQPWERLWRDCYTYALPIRGHGLGGAFAPASSYAERLFDATAADAIEQLAASLLAELMPPWSRWFGLKPGHDVDEAEAPFIAPVLDEAAARLQGHFDRSNFAVEIHQCLLDLVTVGTATLLFEEAPPGSPSAFRFLAVPTAEMYIDGGTRDVVRRQYRVTVQSVAELQARFPDVVALLDVKAAPDTKVEIVEAFGPGPGGTAYTVFTADPLVDGGRPIALQHGRFETSPFITFRWMKGTGEIYGRSPVMTALPDIRTANKVVELILKNASIAVTGIWLAEDDGVLNPANIRLTPGSIIPKAVGSAGLTPLQAPGRFDVSELILSDLRGKIRHTLLVDRLAPVDGRNMTATEVLARDLEMTRLLGAVYGRLQAELLTPLLVRSVAILTRRGEIPAFALDGAAVELDYRSPLARVQAREDARNTMLWLDTAAKLGPLGSASVDIPAAVRYLGEMLGVPRHLITDPADLLLGETP